LSHHLETFPQELQRAGYETAFLGKWHMGNDPTPREGFDTWVAIPGQGRTTDPELYEDGRIHTVEGYITDVLTDRAVSFIEKERGGQPFFLYIGHKAIHPDARQLDDGSIDRSHPHGYVPAPRHLGRYEDEVFPRRENVVTSPEDLIGKPALQRALRMKNSDEMVEMFGAILDLGTSEETIRRRAEMLLAVDESLGRIVEVVDASGQRDDTFILFMSDNGFFYGEHGLSLERRLPYEESVRTPLLIRYPALVQPGTRIDDLALSIDVAPTVLDVGGAEIGDHVQGRSLVPLLQGGETDWRQSVLIEFYTYENPMPWLLDMDYRAVRTDRYKYIHWMHHPDESELYDLETDPYETKNVIDDPAMAGVVQEMRRELSRLVLEAMELQP
jgi:N-acetylglucosamine-6-sulfatase